MSDKKGESFEDFVYKMQELNPHQEFSLTEFLRQTWNHQQKKIDELEKSVRLLKSFLDEQQRQNEELRETNKRIAELEGKNQKLREVLEFVDNIGLPQWEMLTDYWYGLVKNRINQALEEAKE